MSTSNLDKIGIVLGLIGGNAWLIYGIGSMIGENMGSSGYTHGTYLDGLGVLLFMVAAGFIMPWVILLILSVCANKWRTFL